MKEKKTMTKENETIKTSKEERTNARLRERLQKAVNQESTPARLREKIRQMIRQ